MFKRITMIAAVAALAVVMTPAASQAGGVHKREARTACPITKLLHRTARPARKVAARTHVRPARVHKVRTARVHKRR